MQLSKKIVRLNEVMMNDRKHQKGLNVISQDLIP